MSNRRTCEHCGKFVLINKKNCVLVNNVPFHADCYKKRKGLDNDVKKSEKQQAKDDLWIAIQSIVNKQEIFLTKSQQVNIFAQIEQLVKEGYDYKTQQEAFEHYFNKEGKEYKGYGIMLYVIAQEVAEIEKEKKINHVINADNKLSIREMLEKQR